MTADYESNDSAARRALDSDAKEAAEMTNDHASTDAVPSSGTSLATPLAPDSIPLLIEDVRRGAKPEAAWRCGLEWELIGYTSQTLTRLDANEVESVLGAFIGDESLCVREGGRTIEVAIEEYGGRLTIEPGGQIEFSGHPQSSLARTHADANAFLSRLHAIAEERGFVFLAVGFDPVRTLAEQRWFPKERYAVMRPYLAQAGSRSRDMMTRTAAVQCNLDFASDDDLARKLVLATRLAPVTTAIFANSPFENGRPSGYKSTRAAVWLRTDPARTCAFPSTLDGEFTLERFVADALRVPLIFVRREGHYDARIAGMPFGEFLGGGARRFGLDTCLQDWRDHLSTIFTDTRLRPHLELRSHDANNLPLTMAAQALWRGLLYDADALDAALRIAPRLTIEGIGQLSELVARDGLRARFEKVDVLAIAKDMVRLAAEGLRRAAPDEVGFLDPLRELILEDEMSPADVLLKNWNGAWGGRIEPVVECLREA